MNEPSTTQSPHDKAEEYLDWFRHQANPRTLVEANIIADTLATLLEEVWGFDADA